MSNDGDATTVKASLNLGEENLDLVKLIENELHVNHAAPQEPGCFWVLIRAEAECPGAEMSGLNDSEAMGSPEVGNWGVAVERGEII
jgi:hypothetical protein